VRVGIIGGTGPAGRALAARLSDTGSEVLLGSRSKERGEEIAAEITAHWPTRALRLSGCANAEAAACEIVVVATPWDGAVSSVVELADVLRGRVVVSMVNAVARFGREFQALVPVRGSVAATMQAALPGSQVTTAFQHVPAGPLGELEHPVECDVLICADERAAGEKTAQLVESVPGFRAVHAGSLASANAVEALTAVLINVNVRYRAHVAISLLGLDTARGASS
jgi:8-hydroxy-5-deazaflavin:NADPH oxidoreductase